MSLGRHPLLWVGCHGIEHGLVDETAVGRRLGGNYGNRLPQQLYVTAACEQLSGAVSPPLCLSPLPLQDSTQGKGGGDSDTTHLILKSTSTINQCIGHIACSTMFTNLLIDHVMWLPCGC